MEARAATGIEIVRLDERLADQLDQVADRMRATLVEVLGREAGASMYSLEWLRDRAASHVDGRCPGAIFIAREPSGGGTVGHVIVRQEADADGSLGLVSTLYVVPAARRQGVARRLVDAAHRWFHARGLHRLATDTSEANLPLIRLFTGFGYEIVFRSDDRKMVRLMNDARPSVAGGKPG